MNLLTPEQQTVLRWYTAWRTLEGKYGSMAFWSQSAKLKRYGRARVKARKAVARLNSLIPNIEQTDPILKHLVLNYGRARKWYSPSFKSDQEMRRDG